MDRLVVAISALVIVALVEGCYPPIGHGANGWDTRLTSGQSTGDRAVNPICCKVEWQGSDVELGLGSISVEGRFSDDKLAASIGVDCCGSARDYMSLVIATRHGLASKGTIRNGETLIIDVPPGEHELFAFDNTNLTGLSIVQVASGKTQRLVCTDKDVARSWEPTYPKFGFDLSNVTAGVGRVAVEARLAHRGDVVSISVGERWYKDCHPSRPGDGFLSGHEAYGIIRAGETKIFEVPAGNQTVDVSGGDFTWGDKIAVDVVPGKTKKVICTTNLNCIERSLYPITFLIRGGRSKPYYRLVSAE